MSECVFYIFYLLLATCRATSTSSTSLALEAEMRLTLLAKSGSEEKFGCRDLSESIAAEANSFAEDPSRHLRFGSSSNLLLDSGEAAFEPSCWNWMRCWALGSGRP